MDPRVNELAIRVEIKTGSDNYLLKMNKTYIASTLKTKQAEELCERIDSSVIDFLKKEGIWQDE